MTQMRMNVRISVATMVATMAAALTGLVLAAPAADAAEPLEEQTVAAIRESALAPNEGPHGRPLPLTAHWHRNSMPLSWQIEQIQQGHHILPWLAYGRKGGNEAQKQADALKWIAQHKLPLVLITGGQWEADFYSDPQYKDLPADQTGVGVNLKGNRINAVSPFSPIEPWEKLGHKWTDNPMANALQELYPDPPLVLFVSNNEAHDMRWHNAEKLQRYMDMYGEGRDDNFKRKVFGDGWIERYRALISGMRSGLTNPTWRDNSRFVAYNAFGPDHFARWGGWEKYSLHTEDRVTWNWFAWEGAIPESYDNHWEPGKRAYNVWSPQTEMMNLVFMKDLAFQANPSFWHEVIFWDGYLPDKDNDKRKQYAQDGHPYTPELYRGWTQYVMWTLTPRVAREWRGSSFDKENWLDYYNQLVEAVDLVHADPVLAEFWRRGELVPNRDRKHPFQSNVPEKWKDVDRWFHLTTNLDPAEFKLDATMPVYTLARVIGEPGQRRWLVYAHAPIGEAQQDVQITIPDYQVITVDVPVEGAFHIVQESDGSVTQVGQ